jgi:hypothetical protein
MLKKVLKRFREWFLAPIFDPVTERFDSAVPQLLLAHRYRELRRLGAPLPPLAQVGFSVFSESDEDGIVL